MSNGCNMGSNKWAEKVGIALIGLGRAGSIHFHNCLGNRRIDLRYLVDYDVDKCKRFIDSSFLESTKVLAPDQLMTALGKNLISSFSSSNLRIPPCCVGLVFQSVPAFTCLEFHCCRFFLVPYCGILELRFIFFFVCSMEIYLPSSAPKRLPNKSALKQVCK